MTVVHLTVRYASRGSDLRDMKGNTSSATRHTMYMTKSMKNRMARKKDKGSSQGRCSSGLSTAKKKMAYKATDVMAMEDTRQRIRSVCDRNG